jgi:hypothetical protein
LLGRLYEPLLVELLGRVYELLLWVGADDL